ncbi:hypothetical protein HDV57DRAFT_57403 [Trichoderma longibrachiatum]
MHCTMYPHTACCPYQRTRLTARTSINLQQGPEWLSVCCTADSQQALKQDPRPRSISSACQPTAWGQGCIARRPMQNKTTAKKRRRKETSEQKQKLAVRDMHRAWIKHRGKTQLQLLTRQLRNLGSAVTSTAALLSSSCFFGDATHDSLVFDGSSHHHLQHRLLVCGGWPAVIELDQGAVHLTQLQHAQVSSSIGIEAKSDIARSMNHLIHTCLVSFRS